MESHACKNEGPSPRYRLHYGRHHLTVTFRGLDDFSNHLEQQAALQAYFGRLDGLAWHIRRPPYPLDALFRRGPRMIEGLVFRDNRRKPNTVALPYSHLIHRVATGGITLADGTPACMPDINDLLDELREEMLTRANPAIRTYTQGPYDIFRHMGPS